MLLSFYCLPMVSVNFFPFVCPLSTYVLQDTQPFTKRNRCSEISANRHLEICLPHRECVNSSFLSSIFKFSSQFLNSTKMSSGVRFLIYFLIIFHQRLCIHSLQWEKKRDLIIGFRSGMACPSLAYQPWRGYST